MLVKKQQDRKNISGIAIPSLNRLMNASGIFFEVVEIYEARKKLPKCTDESFSPLTNISGEVDLRYFLCSEVPILQHPTVLEVDRI